MPSLVAGPQSPRAATVVQAEGFWPSIVLADAGREMATVDGTVTDEKLVQALTAAVTDVNRRLQPLYAAGAAAGIARLADMPALAAPAPGPRLGRAQPVCLGGQSLGPELVAPAPAALPGPQQGPSSKPFLYRRAVYELAMADLIERYVTYDATQRATDQGDTRQASADAHRRNATWAVAGLLGRPRVAVELL